LPHTIEVLLDPFGNYVLQKIIELCSGEQQLALTREIAPCIVAASMDLRGSRALQQLVDLARSMDVVRNFLIMAAIACDTYDC
jgi:pumilio RNA-binding family